MYDNLSNLCRVTLACENVQLFKLNKTNMVSVEEPGASRPSSRVSFQTAAAIWRKADTIDIPIKTSSIWFGPEMNGLMFMQ